MKITIELDSVAELLEVSGALSKFKAALDSGAKSLAELGISIRAQNCLANGGISSVDDLLIATDSDLLRLPNFGRKDLVDVRTALTKIGGKT